MVWYYEDHKYHIKPLIILLNIIIKPTISVKFEHFQYLTYIFIEHISLRFL